MSDLFRYLQTALADRYQLERELGRGGMATVYLARELKHPRRVAIKVLRPELVGVLARERFLREIRISSEFTHPHILPLLDSGTVPASADYPALPLYTMPYVEGESLRDRLSREKQLPVEDALAITRDVAAALGYAHAHGVIHRDIKPENILLTGGQAVVADFGIARAIQEAVDPDALTSAGLVIGTPAYMSPEQAGGETTLDGRSDLYSLGCVLYEMLGGEPPFTGSSVQAVLARHRLDRAPSLRTIRGTVPEPVEQVVMRVLQKSPADRYATAEQLVEALTAGASGETRTSPVQPRWLHRRSLLIGVVCATAALLAWWGWTRDGSTLDANKVVVFPLTERGAAVRAGTGQEIALMIGSALEHTEPLKWIDGWTWLSASQRANVGQLGARDASTIARRRSARYYLDGAVVAGADSNRVILRLNESGGDSVIAQATAAGSRDSATFPQLGLRAINLLLPRLLQSGKRIDLASLAERRPAAIADWLQGERQYRRASFDSALSFLRRATNEDSLLAVAALRGAQAASWKNRIPEAVQLAQAALKNDSLLSANQVEFARGLTFYLTGRADSAVHWLKQALRRSPDWAEAHMALGEVYHHLLPVAATPLDSLARQEFAAAARDSGFAPPHFHLAELAIRDRRVDLAEREVARFEALGGGVEERSELDLMLACLRQGTGQVVWRGAIEQSPLVVLGSAKMLSVAATFPDCAENGSRILRAGAADEALSWGAFFLLANLLAAEGRDTAITALVDSVRAAGLWQATTVYLVDALAGTPRMEVQAAFALRVLQEVMGPDYETSLDYSRLLLIGTWYAQRGRVADAERLHRRLLQQASATRSPEAHLLAAALGAHILVARGDSSGALLQLQQLEPIAERDLLVWGFTESLPMERLTLARLQFAMHRYQEATDIAATFDHPTPIVYLAYLPASLVVRYRAALALGRPAQAAMFERRLRNLGRADLIPVDAS